MGGNRPDGVSRPHEFRYLSAVGPVGPCSPHCPNRWPPGHVEVGVGPFPRDRGLIVE